MTDDDRSRYFTERRVVGGLALFVALSIVLATFKTTSDDMRDHLTYTPTLQSLISTAPGKLRVPNVERHVTRAHEGGDCKGTTLTPSIAEISLQPKDGSVDVLNAFRHEIHADKWLEGPVDAELTAAGYDWRLTAVKLLDGDRMHLALGVNSTDATKWMLKIYGYAEDRHCW